MKSKAFYHIAAIQNEYKRIDGKWLRMQYQLMLWLVFVTAVVEAVMFFVLNGLGAVNAAPGAYLLKYILAPLACNLLLSAAAALAMRSRLTDREKTYAVSLLMSVMALVVYTVHAVFYALFLIFTIPMVLTIVYGDLLLTCVTGLFCIGGKVASDLFLVWDDARPDVLANNASLADFSLSVLLLVLFGSICGFLIKIEREKTGVSINLERERQRYQEESMTDALTRVWNRQALGEAFQGIEERRDERFYLAMMDLDDFKVLNDTYGHTQGDQYLRMLGAVLRELSTERVTPFRFGGDEFCVLFFDCDQEEVRAACRRIQEQFAQAEDCGACRTVSLSVGVAKFRPGEGTAELLNRADMALYRAKREKGSVWFE